MNTGSEAGGRWYSLEGAKRRQDGAKATGKSWQIRGAWKAWWRRGPLSCRSPPFEGEGGSVPMLDGTFWWLCAACEEPPRRPRGWPS